MMYHVFKKLDSKSGTLPLLATSNMTEAFEKAIEDIKSNYPNAKYDVEDLAFRYGEAMFSTEYFEFKIEDATYSLFLRY